MDKLPAILGEKGQLMDRGFPLVGQNIFRKVLGIKELKRRFKEKMKPQKVLYFATLDFSIGVMVCLICHAR